MPTLRPYQVDAVDRAFAAWLRVRRVLLVAPTGAGKTVLAAEIIDRFHNRGEKVLFLAHRQELIDQTCEKLTDVGAPHGVIMGSRVRTPDAPVQVASIQTLLNRPKPRAGLVIIDEAHRARAKSYETILSHYPHAKVLLLTATPWRTDGKGLGPVADDLVLATTTAELIRQGHLADYTGVVFKALDTSEIGTRAGEFKQDDLSREAMSEKGKAIVGDVVEQYVLRARGKRAVVFAVSIEHSKFLADRFREAGVAAEHADGEMPTVERAAVIRRVREGRTVVLCNCNLVSEGFDLPALEVVILARPTASVSAHLQMLGRGLRPFPGKALAIFHDHAGNLERLGLPDDDRDYSLTGDGERKKRQGGTAPKTCAECKTRWFGGPMCPTCGAAAAPKEPGKDAGETSVETIMDFEAVPIEHLRRGGPGRERVEDAFLRHSVRTALDAGHDPKKALFDFKAKFKANAPFNRFLDALAWAKERVPDHERRRADYLSDTAPRTAPPKTGRPPGPRQSVANAKVTEAAFQSMLDGFFANVPAVTREHRILGVSAEASPEDIKSAYRRLAHVHHPDKGGDPAKMAELTEAYNKLTAT